MEKGAPSCDLAKRQAIGIFALLSLLAWSGCDREPVPASRAPAVVLIGLDGATWDIIDPMIEAGQLPNLARLRRTGVHGNLGTLLPSLSPALWTTIATGKTPEKHGITGFFGLDEKGQRVPLTSDMRRAHAFWETLGDHDRSSLVIYWWNTWPAEEIRGAMVSDYLFYARNAARRRHETEKGEILMRAAYPPDLVPVVVSELKRAEQLSPELVRRIVPFDESQMQSFLADVGHKLGRPSSGQLAEVLKNKLVESEFHLGLGLELLGRQYFDLYAYYSKGIDAAGHTFWRFYEPDAPAYRGTSPDPEELALYANVIPNFYAYEDANIGKILEHTDDDTYVLVISDHGQHAGGHEDGPDGIFLLAGPGVRAGVSLDGVRIQDVAPLLFYLLDVPVAVDLDGRVPQSAFTDPHIASHPIRESPASPPRLRTPSAELDEGSRAELERELRVLGYIE